MTIGNIVLGGKTFLNHQCIDYFNREKILKVADGQLILTEKAVNNNCTAFEVCLKNMHLNTQLAKRLVGGSSSNKLPKYHAKSHTTCRDYMKKNDKRGKM